MKRSQPAVPAPGQESVWAYPRPPRLEHTAKRLQIWLGGELVADTDWSRQPAFRVLETSHPPGYYLPPDAFAPGVLSRASGSSVCEWKGQATYWTLSGGGRVAPRSGWSYESPTPAFREMAGCVAVYAGQMDECRVAGEVVTPQPGDFYGGWITADVVGPFKGEPGSWGW
ncbi:hypothetical protein DKM44_04815 [Deinococcus irradiatisoli]|uniref:DUF427 domain-containing protein n=1 Tax=Deinococcus irradiatisoli TaxID=2202254 RepID=A0A2Z3JF70_9DEIO|nr:DUF427 domain-containing protein [Deinococcus irradiatisoli]AWN22636.1 hypothetical protein DKM44_04815 [Deinococcus irradiatisoli]